MDWNAAVERNREALKRVLARLVAMAGLGGADPGSPSPLPGEAGRGHTLPRHLHRAVLRLLRPAEAAARRLVIAAAREIVCGPAPAARPRKGRARGGSEGKSPRPFGFRLFDTLPRRRIRRRPAACAVPRIWAPGCRDPFPVPARREPLPDDPVDAARLGLRLSALGRVLDDLPAQARRFARWRANRDAASVRIERRRDAVGAQKRAGYSRYWPLKPGLPPGARRPGGRRRHDREIDEILSVAHGLAFRVLTQSDTS